MTVGRLRVPPAPSESLSGMSAGGCFGLLLWVPGRFWVLFGARGLVFNDFVWILFDLGVFFLSICSVYTNMHYIFMILHDFS